MHEIYLIPEWFLDFSVLMEILFSLVTLAVAISGIAIYRISKEKSLRRFSLGFLMISVSYAAWAALNGSIASKLDEGMLVLSLTNPSAIQIAGVYAYVIFFIAGLVTLAYTTIKIDRPGVYYLLLGLAMTAVVASVSKFVTFRIVSLFLLTFIAYHYFNERYINENTKTSWVFLAFFLLVISNISFIFTANATTYVIGHILELGAYSILLVNLLKTLRRR